MREEGSHSGLVRRFRKPIKAQAFRGFDSHPFRHKYMSEFDEARNPETITTHETIKRGLEAWAEIFPRQQPADDKLIKELDQGLYVVGDRYPLDAKTNEDRLTGVRLGYSKTHGGLWLYANDYHGDPAPILMQLADELRGKGVEIVFVNRQGAYDPPNTEVTRAAIDKFNSEHSRK